VNGE
jgi:hypothetical protein